MAENNDGSPQGAVLKRKYSSDSSSEDDSDGDKHENIRPEPKTSSTIIIDEQGDMYMDLDNGRLKVSRKALTLGSPVFMAMLGPHSPFAESANRTFDNDGTQIVAFKDDDLETMAIVTRIIHLQSDKVPDSLSFAQLYQIAVVCDKYDLKRCLGPWPKMWSTPYLDSYRMAGYEGWLFMSIVFQYDGLFKEITRHFILNTRMTKEMNLVINQGHDISERISPNILGRIRKSRAELGVRIAKQYSQEFNRLRFSGQKRVCNVSGGKQAMCDAINLGCLCQRHPVLCQPLPEDTEIENSISDWVADYIHILEGSSSIIYKWGNHSACSVGSRLGREVKKLADAVEGLDLKK